MFILTSQKKKKHLFYILFLFPFFFFSLPIFWFHLTNGHRNHEGIRHLKKGSRSTVKKGGTVVGFFFVFVLKDTEYI